MSALLSYSGDNQDSEQSSDSEFVGIPSLFSSAPLICRRYNITNFLLQESDLYEDPQGDYNYEPPPCERVFSPPRKINYTGGDYLGMMLLVILMIPTPRSRFCLCQNICAKKHADVKHEFKSLNY